MADDNQAPPAAAAPAPTSVPLVPREPETFTREYVRELREENRGLRLKTEEQTKLIHAADETARKARDEADAAVAAARADAEKSKADAEGAAGERVIRAELRTAAIRAGMVDLDGLKLADLSAAKLNHAGEVEGADALVEALKAAKPYLFGQAPAPPGNTNPTPPPAPKPPGGRKASDLSDEEWKARLRDIDAGKGLPR